jgi:hypothetical protein
MMFFGILVINLDIFQLIISIIKMPNFSIESCSKSNGNVFSSIKTSTNSVINFQNIISDSITEIIQNKTGKDYIRSEIGLNIVTPGTPDTPGTGGFIISFSADASHPSDDINQGLNDIYVAFDQITGNFTVGDNTNPDVIFPAINATVPGGTTINSVNIIYNTTSSIITINLYYIPPSGIPDVSNITRSLTFNVATFLANAVPPIDATTAISPFTFIMKNDNGTTYPNVPPTNFFNPSMLSPGTLFGITLAADSYGVFAQSTDIVTGGSVVQDIEIEIQPGTPFIPGDPPIPGDPIYLFSVPSNVTQAQVPSVDLVRRFFLKDDALTLGTTTLITDPEIVKLVEYIAKEIFSLGKKAASLLDEENSNENDLCTSLSSGRYQGCISNCIFSLIVKLN